MKKNKPFGLGFKVILEKAPDDLSEPFKRLPKALARAMRETYEDAAANVFHNAFKEEGKDNVRIFRET